MNTNAKLIACIKFECDITDAEWSALTEPQQRAVMNDFLTPVAVSGSPT